MADASVRDIPELNSAEKTGTKNNEGLNKVVNAIISIETSKECMLDLEKQYQRPENCYLKVPRVNKEIWDVTGKNADAVNLKLQVIQKSIASGMTLLKLSTDGWVSHK